MISKSQIQSRFLRPVIPILLIMAIGLCIVALPANQAKAASLLKVGLLKEPKTLNVWLGTDRWTRRVLSQVFNTLYIYHPETLDFVPWLAAELPVFDEKSLSYTVKLREAKWSDGTDFTSDDVAFTGKLIKDFKMTRWNAYWKFINRIETPDKHTVVFYLKEPKAIFVPRTLLTPMVQKKKWEEIALKAKEAEKPLKALLNHKIESPVGSGPFTIKEWKKGAYLFLKKNEHFFGTGQNIGGLTLGPHINGIIFKFYGTSDAAVLALKKGDIDMFWWGIQAGYMEDLEKDENIQLFKNERSALYYMGFNSRKPPFSDPTFRRAVATLIDKEFIISRILQGNGEKMNSIVPPGNEVWYSPEVPTYGEGLSKEDRIIKAYGMLKEAGYTWKVPPLSSDGKLVKGEGLRSPEGRPVKDFTILTPQADYDPARAMAGMIIQEWLKDVGIPTAARPMSLKALIDQVKKRRDFDSFILGYGRLNIDPDYLRLFFHSRYDKPRGRNTSGYNNAEFDRISDESARTMDGKKRKELVWEMQKMIMQDVPWIPLYNPKLVEAVRKDKLSGWVQMMEGIGNHWSFCTIKPK